MSHGRAVATPALLSPVAAVAVAAATAPSVDALIPRRKFEQVLDVAGAAAAAAAAAGSNVGGASFPVNYGAFMHPSQAQGQAQAQAQAQALQAQAQAAQAQAQGQSGHPGELIRLLDLT